MSTNPALSPTAQKRQPDENGNEATNSSPCKARHIEHSLKTVSSSSSMFTDDLGSEIVEFIVGPERKSFHLHRNLIAKSNAVFHRMLRGHFREATEDKIELPEDSVEAFRLFVEWAYKGQVPKLPGKPESKDFMARVEMYCFSEKYDIKELLDSVIDQIYPVTCLPMSWIGYAYDNAKEGSPLRKLAARDFCYHLASTDIDATKFSSLANEIPDLTTDVFTLLRASRMDAERLDPHYGPCCQFHCHTPQELFDCPVFQKRNHHISDDARDIHSYMQRFEDRRRSLLELKASKSLNLSTDEIFWAVAELVATGEAQYVSDDNSIIELIGE